MEYATAKFAYKTLMMNYITLIVNLLCMGTYAAAGDNNGNKFENCGMAVAFILFGIPGAFYGWWRIVYAACKDKSNTYYMCAMCTILASSLFWLSGSAGFPASGNAGLWEGLNQMKYWEGADGDDVKMGYFIAMCAFGLGTILHVVTTIMSFVLFKKVRELWYGAGGEETAQANAEVAGRVAKLGIQTQK